MKDLNIAICDDDREEILLLENIIKNIDASAKVYSFSCGEDLLKQFHPKKYDLILMDIYMNGISGIDTIKEICKTDDKVVVSFITSCTDYALESYRLNAIKYIEKPVTAKAVQEVLEFVRYKKGNVPKLNIFSNGSNISIPFDEIIYIEQKNHNIYIHIENGEAITCYEKLDNIVKLLDSKCFVHCHKSYIVNLQYVMNLDLELMMFVMQSGDNVYISRRNLSSAKKAFEAYLFDSLRGECIG